MNRIEENEVMNIKKYAIEIEKKVFSYLNYIFKKLYYNNDFSTIKIIIVATKWNIIKIPNQLENRKITFKWEI